MIDPPALDLAFVAELERLITKLASPMPSFTAKEQALMEMLRLHRHEVLPQLHAAMATSLGTSPAGRQKLERLVRAIEEICQVN